MERYDIGIVGSGLSGIAAALYLAEARPDLRIILVTKEKLNAGNSYYAQGGIAAVMDISEDSFEQHIQDTLASGGGLSDPEIVEMVIRSAPNCIGQLEKWGVKFDHRNNSKYDLGLEGGHSAPRIVHVADTTGSSIMTHLLLKLKSISSITVKENNVCYCITVNHQGVVNGLKTFDTLSEENNLFHCKYVILGSGGCGQVFRDTTNPASANGDGIYLARSIGALVTNMRYIQFHPTALKSNEEEKLFLISEAVRGYGAFLLNKKQERFLFNVDKRGELATRDIVAKAMFDLLRKNPEEQIYLDCRHLDETLFSKHFPAIYAHLQQLNYSIKNDLIPVKPAAHYQCGGIRVNEAGQTSVDRLYAIGECSDTGLHGINRLASNSLLEALVFAFKSSDNILNSIDSDSFLDIPSEDRFKLVLESGSFYSQIKVLVKDVMTNYFNSSSSESEMFSGMGYLNELERIVKNHKESNPMSLERFNTEVLMSVSREIVYDHFKRKSSKNLPFKRMKMSENKI